MDAAEYSLVPLKGGGTYLLRLEEEVMTLAGADGHVVLMLPRGEAAKYLRFDWDVRRGRLIEFRLLGGLRSMRFLCGREVAAGVTAWLPVPAAPWMETRQVLLALVALLGLAWPPMRGAGAMALVAAAALVLPLGRYGAGIVAGVTGLVALFALFGPALGLIGGPPAIPFLYGVVLALVALEHLALAGPNSVVFAARRAASGQGARRHVSLLVRRVAYAAGATAAAFAGVGAALYFFTAPVEGSVRAVTDAMVFGGAALALGVTVPWLLLRAHPPYGGALIVAQGIIAVIVVYGWGLGAGALGSAVDYSAGVFEAAVSNSPRPYFALPLLVLEMAFRSWFVRAAEREAAEAD